MEAQCVGTNGCRAREGARGGRGGLVGGAKKHGVDRHVTRQAVCRACEARKQGFDVLTLRSKEVSRGRQVARNAQQQTSRPHPLWVEWCCRLRYIEGDDELQMQHMRAETLGHAVPIHNGMVSAGRGVKFIHRRHH